jgi:hypothetical protein
MHAADDLAGMAAFAWTVLGDNAGLAEIHFSRHPPDKSAGTGDDGSDLERPFQESLKENGAHSGCRENKGATIRVPKRVVQRDNWVIFPDILMVMQIG